MRAKDIDDLNAVVSDADDLLAKINDNGLRKQLEALEAACDSIDRAWSGSNLGYHANVYYHDLNPKPAHVEFSSEWGLMDRWPTHQPDRGWVKMDDKAVEREILDRAGVPDLDKIRKYYEPLRDEFASLKATLTSILSAVLSGKTKDAYLQQRLDRAERTDVPSAARFAQAMLPGQMFSRDSLAMTQGLKVAPHQAVASEVVAIRALEREVGTLKNSARESANHIRRLLPTEGTMTGGPIFCGHGASLIWRELKDFLEDRLDLTVDEFNRVSTAGIPTATRLKEMLDGACFAFLVFTGEDEQPGGEFRARENVVHEAGLFQGRLGFTKAIVLLEDGCEEFSNIHGLGQIRFPKGRISAAFEEIRRVLEREGVIGR